MDILHGLLSGFSVALELHNIVIVTIGVLVGTIIGLIPGLGPVTAIALLLPFTYELNAASAVMLLAGIYYGSMYGGRIPAILLRLPGDASAVVTTFDGYPMTQQGKAGRALSITAIGSFIGGTVAIIGLSVLAPTLAHFAGSITAPDMFVLAALGLLMIAFIGSGSTAKALVMGGLGILVAAIGIDPISGADRLTFGSLNLLSGINIVAVAVGLFGIGEILYTAEQGFFSGASQHRSLKAGLPSRTDWLRSRLSILRGSIIGFLIGIIPGGGGTVSSVVAYGVEKKISRRPQRFGRGAVEGLAATETADNASSNSSFIPLLTLGVPPNPVLALIFGALLMQNIVPGPNLVSDHPDVFWGVIASMYIGNLLLLVLNLPLVGVFVQLLRVRGTIMGPIILLVAVCGVYSVRTSMFDVGVAVVFGIVGYVLRKARFDLGPFILGFILGPILEVQFRRTMRISDGHLGIFLERPLTFIVGLIILTAVVSALVNKFRAGQEKLRLAANDPDATLYI